MHFWHFEKIFFRQASYFFAKKLALTKYFCSRFANDCKLIKIQNLQWQENFN